ncbi:uncharacterized protein LOC144153333 [Haemaphysalis longicornis]
MALLSVVFAWVDIFGAKIQGETPTRVTNACSSYLWMLFENMLCEASTRPPRGAVLRILSATWWIAIVVLMNAFAGQMRACLMVKTELEKIDTLSDVAARPYLKVYILKETEITRYLEASKGAAERAVWRMIRRDKTDIYGLFRYSDEMLIEIAQERAVVLHAKMVSQNEGSKFCKRTQVGEYYFGTQDLSNWMFVSYINRYLNQNVRYGIEKM